MRMISNRLASNFISSYRFCSKAEHTLKIGDILQYKRTFTIEDVVEYSQPGAVYVSQNLQFKQPVYVGDEIVGEVQATKIRDFKKNCLVKFSTRCLKKASDLVIDGEATAILPSLILQRQDGE